MPVSAYHAMRVLRLLLCVVVGPNDTAAEILGVADPHRTRYEHLVKALILFGYGHVAIEDLPEGRRAMQLNGGYFATNELPRELFGKIVTHGVSIVVRVLVGDNSLQLAPGMVERSGIVYALNRQTSGFGLRIRPLPREEGVPLRFIIYLESGATVIENEQRDSAQVESRPLLTSTWYEVCATIGVDGRMCIYVDGELHNENVNGKVARIFDNGRLYVGCDGPDTHRVWHGMFQDIRVYAEVLGKKHDIRGLVFGGILAQDLQSPHQLCEDSDGNLLVASYGAHCVFRISMTDGTILSTCGQGVLTHPCGVGTGNAGRDLYLCDYYGAKLVKCTADATVTGTFGQEGSGETQFKNPFHIAVGANELFITDTNNHRVVVRSRDAPHNVIRTINIEGRPCADLRGIAADSATHLCYVGCNDQANATVEVFNTITGRHVRSIGQHLLKGAYGLSIDAERHLVAVVDGPARTVHLFRCDDGARVHTIRPSTGVPSAVLFDRRGRLLISCDNHVEVWE